MEDNIYNRSECIRMEGISEDSEKSKSENVVPTTEDDIKILDDIGVKPTIQELNDSRISRARY